jgi:hypothetical protein
VLPALLHYCRQCSTGTNIQQPAAAAGSLLPLHTLALPLHTLPSDCMPVAACCERMLLLHSYRILLLSPGQSGVTPIQANFLNEPTLTCDPSHCVELQHLGVPALISGPTLKRVHRRPAACLPCAPNHTWCTNTVPVNNAAEALIKH